MACSCARVFGGDSTEVGATRRGVEGAGRTDPALTRALPACGAGARRFHPFQNGTAKNRTQNGELATPRNTVFAGAVARVVPTGVPVPESTIRMTLLADVSVLVTNKVTTPAA